MTNVGLMNKSLTHCSVKIESEALVIDFGEELSMHSGATVMLRVDAL